jgi:hypothetical protein
MNEQHKKLLGEIISRTTMAVAGLAMLFGGWKCLSVAYRIWQDYLKDRSDLMNGIQYHTSSEAGLPAIIGVVLVLPGGFFVLASILSVGLLARWFRAPTATVFDGAEEDQARNGAGIVRGINRL